jgi:magnesium chelatase family protein
MTFEEIIETNKIYSISGKLNIASLTTARPFRAPHHTISQAGLIGGGSYPQPGEISLAHHGILFLDELTEFRRIVLESLRQPLENKNVCIARAQQSITFPANPLLVVALNPCPCGYWSDKKRACVCSSQDIHAYLKKLSGPFLDRIDLQVHVQSLEYETLKSNASPSHSSHDLAITVTQAVQRQKDRLGNNYYNGTMPAEMLQTACAVTPQAEIIIKKAFDRLRLSMRGYHKLLKVSRTIADLDESDVIDEQHVHEAIMYRSLDYYLEKAHQ